MALSNRFSFPFLNPHKKEEEEPDPPQQPAEALPAPAPSRAPQSPLPPPQALARIEPLAPAVIDPALSGPPAQAVTPYLPPQSAPLAPPVPEVPLYLRNPGKPPRLPRNPEVDSQWRSSFRFRRVGRSAPNYRPLLWLCAAVGVVLLYLLVVARIHTRPLELPFAPRQAEITPVASTPLLDLKAVMAPVGPNEQFALVMVAEGKVLEEPRAGAIVVQELQKYTFIALQRKSTAGWYQLKGGSGWIAALDIKTYPTEQAAWDEKRKLEKSQP